MPTAEAVETEGAVSACSPGDDLSSTLIFSTQKSEFEPNLNGFPGTKDAKYITDYDSVDDRIGLYNLSNPSSIGYSELNGGGSFDLLKGPDISGNKMVSYWKDKTSSQADQIAYRFLGQDGQLGTTDDKEVIIKGDPANNCGSAYFVLTTKISDNSTKTMWWEWKTPICDDTASLFIYEAGADKKVGTADDALRQVASGLIGSVHTTDFSLANTHAAWLADSKHQLRMTHFGPDKLLGTADDVSDVLIAQDPLLSTNLREIEVYENGIAYTKKVGYSGAATREIYVYDFGADRVYSTADDIVNARLVNDQYVGTITDTIGVKDGVLVYTESISSDEYTILKAILAGKDRLFGTLDDQIVTILDEGADGISKFRPSVKRTPLGYIITYQRDADYYFLRKCLQSPAPTPTPI